MEAIKLKTAVLERLTHEEFYHFRIDHSDLRIERDADYQMTIMPPVNSETGTSNSYLERFSGSGTAYRSPQKTSVGCR